MSCLEKGKNILYGFDGLKRNFGVNAERDHLCVLGPKFNFGLQMQYAYFQFRATPKESVSSVPLATRISGSGLVKAAGILDLGFE